MSPLKILMIVIATVHALTVLARTEAERTESTYTVGAILWFIVWLV